MNRFTYLEQTLPVNICENKDYPHLEFVVLDYNSKDNMGTWIRRNLSEHIESGLLQYYKTYEPEYFHSSHAKNMALKLATGDIICMVDADNYAGPGYAQWVDTVFSCHGNNTLITTLQKNSIPYRDQGGKFCLSRELFHAVGGLDEDLVGYGMEDTDLINRMENAGGRRFHIEDEKYLQFIGHSDAERICNFKFPNNLQKIYVRIPRPEAGRIQALYFFTDNTFSEATYEYDVSLKDNIVRSFRGWKLEKNGLRQGTFQDIDGNKSLIFEGNPVTLYKDEQADLISARNEADGVSWKEVKKGDDLYLPYLMAYTECLNRRKYLENDNNLHQINPNGWGKGTVRKNFNEASTLEVV